MLERDVRGSSSALGLTSLPGMVDQDTAHQAGGEGDEVHGATPLHPSLVDETQVGFVNQGGRLQRVLRAFPLQVTRRHAPKLVVDEGHQRCQRLFVAVAPLNEQTGHVTPGVLRHTDLTLALAAASAAVDG